MPDSNVFDLDVSHLPRNVSIIQQELAKINASLSDVETSTLRYNTKSKEMELALKGLTQKGVSFNTTFDASGKVLKNLGTAAKETTRALSQLKKQQLEQAQLTGVRQDVVAEIEAESKERAKALKEAIQKRAEEEKKAAKELARIKAELLIRDIREDKKLRDKGRQVQRNTRKRTAQEIIADIKQQAERELEIRRRAEEAADNLLKKFEEARTRLKTVVANRIIAGIREQHRQQEAAQQRADQRAKNMRKAHADAVIRSIRQEAEREVRIRRVAANQVIDMIRRQQERAQRLRQVAARTRLSAIRRAERAAADARRTEQTGDRAGQRILITWQSVVRLFAVQILHAAFANIRRLFSGAANDALEFAKRVAEVRTIIGDASETTEDWSKALRDLGQDLPFSQLQVAEAAYQALSNQVIKTTADLEFVREAGKLAMVGVSDIKTAVNALTSVINAYGEGTYEAANISAVLFKSVELGRTRLSELEQNFGRLTILSSKLGVSIEEQQAAMTTLTVQGLKENVSKTLLVNVYNKLIRPSKRMKELFTEWGVASGEAAIKTYGLENVLNKFGVAVKESGRGLEEVGEIFKRIRATIGYMGIDTEKYTKNLTKLNSAYSDYQKKAEEIQQTLGVSLQQEFSRVNALVIRVGTNFLEMVNWISGASGGLEHALKVVTRAVIDLGVAMATWLGVGRIRAMITSWRTAVAAYTTGFNRITIAAARTRVAMQFLGPALITGAIFAMSELVQYWLLWEERARENIERVRKAFQKLTEKAIEKSNKAITDWVKNMEKGLEKVFKPLRAVNVEITKLQEALEIDLEGSFEALSEHVKNFGKTVNDAMKLDITNLNSNIREIEQRIADAAREIERINKQQASVEKELRDRVFARGQIGKDIAEQARRLEARARSRPVEQTAEAVTDYKTMLKLADKFEAKLKAQATRYVSTLIQEHNARIKALNDASAKGTKKIPTLSITSEYRDELINQRLDHLKTTTNLDSERKRINDQIELLLNRQIDALKEQNLLKEEQKKGDADELKKTQDELKIKTDAQKAFSDAAKRLADFNIEDETEKAEKFSKIEDAKDKALVVRDALLRKLAQRTRDMDLAAQTGEVDPQTRFNMMREIQARRVELYQDAAHKIAQIDKEQLTQQRTEAEEALQQKIKATADAEAKKRDITLENEKTLASELARLQHHAETDPRKRVSNSLASQEINHFIVLIKKAAELNAEIERLRSTDIPVDVLNAKVEQRLALVQKIQEELGGPGSLYGQGRFSNLGDTTSDETSGRLTQALDNIEEAQTAYQKTVEELGNVRYSIDILNQILADNQLDQIKIDEVENENTRSLQELTTEMKLNIMGTAELRKTLIASAAARGIELASGGVVNGPSGIDRVPAWLTAGEYVMNAESTRKFLPVLQAMNLQPQRFNKGGEVRNFSFGNINVTGGTTDRQTARSIARELKHEMRRGTI